MKNIKIASILGIEIALFISFASSNFLMFTWESAIGYYLLIILASFLGGAVIADLTRSLILVSIAFIASCIAFILLMILPLMLYGGASEEIDLVVSITAPQLARMVIISFPISVFTCIFGCFLGRTLYES